VCVSRRGARSRRLHTQQLVVASGARDESAEQVD
jgi:hypothetical protein